MKDYLILILGLAFMLGIVFGIIYSIVNHNMIVGIISLTLLIILSIIKFIEDKNDRYY